MAPKELLAKLSIYIPQKKMAEKPVERLIKLSEKKDRSINYLVVEAILEYLNREEVSLTPKSKSALPSPKRRSRLFAWLRQRS